MTRILVIRLHQLEYMVVEGSLTACQDKGTSVSPISQYSCPYQSVLALPPEWDVVAQRPVFGLIWCSFVRPRSVDPHAPTTQQ